MAINSRKSRASLVVSAAASIGLLLGLFVGLSVSPIVGSVAAGIVALLAAAFGTAPESEESANNEKSKKPLAPGPIDPRFIIAFSLCCMAATVTGVTLRTHHVLEPPMQNRIDAWHNLAFSTDDARRLALYESFGTIPSGVLGVGAEQGDGGVDAKKGHSPDETSGPRSPGVGGLYSAPGSTSCVELWRVPYDSPAAALAAYRNEKGVWSQVADFTAARIPPEHQLSFLRSIKEYLCEYSH